MICHVIFQHYCSLPQSLSISFRWFSLLLWCTVKNEKCKRKKKTKNVNWWAEEWLYLVRACSYGHERTVFLPLISEMWVVCLGERMKKSKRWHTVVVIDIIAESLLYYFEYYLYVVWCIWVSFDPWVRCDCVCVYVLFAITPKCLFCIWISHSTCIKCTTAYLTSRARTDILSNRNNKIHFSG